MTQEKASLRLHTFTFAILYEAKIIACVSPQVTIHAEGETIMIALGYFTTLFHLPGLCSIRDRNN